MSSFSIAKVAPMCDCLFSSSVQRGDTQVCPLSLILSSHLPGWQGGCFSNPILYTGMLPHTPEHKKSCKALTLLQLNLKILLPSTLTLFHYKAGGKILFSANGEENSAVNSKCSLRMGCTGEPKAPLLFCIHLMYPCWGAMSSCAQVSQSFYPQLYASGSLGMREQHKV